MNATLSTALAPDAAVPERDALLDPEVFGAAVAKETSLDVVAVTRLRARYQVGRSLRVLHELEAEGDRFLVAARTFEGDVAQIAHSAREQAVTTRGLPPVIPLRELGAVAWVYPNDRKLHGLPNLGTKVATLLRHKRVEPRLIAWAPEKSATLQCNAEARTLAYAKAHAYTAAARERGFHDELRARLKGCDAVSIPRALGSEGTLLVVEPAPGTPLALLRSSTAVEAYARYGRALAVIHTLAPPPAAPPFARFVRDQLVSATTLIARARTDVAGEVVALARMLVERRPPPTGWACLHGDAHPKNALDDGNRITLIDLEQVAAGDPAAEVGSVLAAFRYRSITGQLDEETAATWQSAFLDAYAQARPLPSARTIAWNTAAALLAERALRAVTRIRGEGLHHLPALLEGAHTEGAS